MMKRAAAGMRTGSARSVSAAAIQWHAGSVQARGLGSYGSRAQRRLLSTVRSGNVLAQEEGTPGTDTYRVFFKEASSGRKLSPWHNIPLTEKGATIAQGVLRYVVEIPKGTTEKMEIATSVPWNPIKQDKRKDGELRFLKHGPVLCNYGAFPQTWEDPNAEAHPQLKLAGDNDPIDVIDLTTRVAQRGEVVKVKVLGAFALVDEGELDWKVIVIDVNDPKAALLNDITDVDQHMPGQLAAVQEWYRVYKVAEGKPENTYAFDDKPLNKDFTLSVLQQGHDSWKKLFTSRSSRKFAYESIGAYW